MIFESHITVEGVSLPRFKAMCRQAQVKPVHIVSDTGSGVEQLMSAHFHHVSSLSKAFVEIGKLMAMFHPAVIRSKLEYIPRPKDVDPPTSFLYEEWHFKFEVAFDYVETLRNLAASAGLHTSINAVRQPQDSDTMFVFATTRSRETSESFRASLFSDETPYWKPVNSIRECVVYDSNPGIDRYWFCDCLLKIVK